METESKKFETLYEKVQPAICDKNTIIFTHTPKCDWSADATPYKNLVYVSGHTHRNEFYDDGEYRIYADNQIGYSGREVHTKCFLMDSEYNIFADYEDGIYEITADQYMDFYRGKNIKMNFGREINILYMLKKKGHYCFIHESTYGVLSILNGKTAAGTDYYYTYGNTLFIVLDTNNYNCATHENVMRKAIKENPNAKWKVVMFHQDIYGSGYDHSDSDGMVLRTQLTPLMDKYDIDVVLQGHDHTYSRTYQLQSDGQAHDKFAKTENTANYAKENNCYEIVDTTKGGTVVNPKGTVYLEANSATGSKFYNLITAKQDFISERSQTWTPSYSVVNVTDDSFEVTTYDADTGKVLDGSSSYKIVKKAEDTKKDDANSNTTKKDDTTAVQTKDQTITATASYKKSETSKAFKLNAKTNGNGKLTYTTSNKAVATVDAAGKVTVKGPGVAKITVKAAATTDYKAASKTVTVTVVPKKQSISLVNKIKKQLTIKWKKNTKASGYQVVYSTNKKFTGKKTVRKAKTTTSYKIKGLKKGKKYYVKVRSYKTVNGKRIYGAYSTAKKATIK